MRWFYDKFHPLCAVRISEKGGTIPDGQANTYAALNLQPGDLVRVKSHEEICEH